MNANQTIPDKLFVRYKNETFDLTKFAKKHPGGRNTLSAVLNSDIEYKFDTAMPHSPAAKYLLKEYRVPPNQVNNNDSKFDSDLSNGNSKYGENIDHKMDGRDSIEHLVKTDESMEVILWVLFVAKVTQVFKQSDS